MKKFFMKIITLFITVIFAFNFVACVNEDNNKPTKPLDPVDVAQYTKGTHIINAVKTDKPFITNAKTQYSIVTPTEISSQISQAVSELLVSINNATTVKKLEVVTDADIIYSDSLKHIVVGAHNALIEQAGLSLTDAQKTTFGKSGYRIVTKGNSVFIFGNTDNGTLFGIYDFIYYMFGIEFFGDGNYSINKSKDVNLIDFDITEIPDFSGRNIGEGRKGENIDAIQRNCEEEEMIAIEGTPYHNTLLLLPMEKYSDHPAWYATNGDLKELCFRAHGDAAEYEAMVKEMAKEAIKQFDEKPNASLLSISQMDGGGGKWCECDACKKARNTYNGANSASMIMFINDVSDAVKKHYADNGIKREVYFTFLCYNHVTDYAPTLRNADGTYSIINGLRCNDNVFPTIAHLDMMHNRTFMDSKNDYYRESLLSWQPIADNVRNWFYSTNFYHYMYPYDAFSTIQDRLKYALENNSKYIFIQGQFDTNGNTGFTSLKAYIESKLAWNVNENVGDLYERYFNGTYGAAAEPMSDLFYSLVGHIVENDRTYEDNAYGYSYHALNQAKYWPKGVLDSWMSLIDNAYDAIKEYKQADPLLYQKMSDNICVESIFIRYILITLYSNNYSMGDLADMRKSFKKDCQRLEIFKVCEGVTLDGLYTSWGV